MPVYALTYAGIFFWLTSFYFIGQLFLFLINNEFYLIVIICVSSSFRYWNEISRCNIRKA